jgi:tetratricopeptide (TPR) repeat protein
MLEGLRKFFKRDKEGKENNKIKKQSLPFNPLPVSRSENSRDGKDQQNKPSYTGNPNTMNARVCEVCGKKLDPNQLSETEKILMKAMSTPYATFDSIEKVNLCSECENAAVDLDYKHIVPGLLAHKLYKRPDVKKMIFDKVRYRQATRIANKWESLKKERKFNEASDCLLEAESIYRQLGKMKDVEACLCNRGVLLTECERFDEAIKLHEEEEQIARKREGENQTDIALCLYNQAINYSLLGKKDKMKSLAEVAIEILNRTNERGDILQHARALIGS